MAHDSPDSWLDAQLRETPLPKALLERLRAIARAEGGNGRLSDAMIDRLLAQVEVPKALIESLRGIARQQSRRERDAAVDRMLGDVPVPVGLADSIRTALEDEKLDERVRNLPVPAAVTARARIIPHLRRRAHPAFRAAAAVLLFCLIGGSYFAGVTVITALSIPPERPALPEMAVEWGPLELESSSPDDATVVIASSEAIIPAQDLASRPEVALEPVDGAPGRGPAGEMQLAFEAGFSPFQSVMDLRWRPLGARWADDDLPNLETVLASAPRGIEPPLVRGFDRVFLFKNGVFPIVDPSAHETLAVSTTPLSTSTACYDLTERLTADRRLPDPHEVRVEDFLAAVDYNFPVPSQLDAVKIRAAAGPSVFGRVQGGLRPQLLQVAAQAGAGSARAAPAMHLTVAIDISASMSWNGRMEMAQRALVRLLDHLGPQDRLSLVAFNEEVAYVVEDAAGDDRQKLLDTIHRLRPAGGTNMDAGLRNAAQLSLSADSSAARRVVLLTDGRAGLPANEAAQMEEFLQEAAEEGLQLDVIDLSQQEEFPEYMGRLALAGKGQVRRGDTADQIRWGLVESLMGRSPIVASNTNLEVTFNPQAVAGYRLLGYEPSPSGADTPGDNSGQLRSLQAATALYEVWLRPNETDDVATARLTWTDAQNGQPREETQRISRLQFSPSWAESPLSLQAASIAAQTAEVLRESVYTPAANRDFGNILAVVSEVNPYLAREESFGRLVRLVRRLDQIQTRRGEP